MVLAEIARPLLRAKAKRSYSGAELREPCAGAGLTCCLNPRWGHDKIGATAYASLDKKGTQQKIHISRKARIVPWIGFRTALWTIAGTPLPSFTLWRQSGIGCLAESCVVAYRPLLSADRWASLLAGPADEGNLIRYASLSGEDLDLILSKRGHRNQLGFAAQICLMRFPGRALALNETPSALLDFLGRQLGVRPTVFV